MVAPPVLADLKAQLNITVATYDAKLTEHLNAAQKIIENRVGPFSTTSFTETVNCRGNGINVSYRPIVTVSSLTPLLNTWPSFATADVAWDPRAGTIWRRDLGTLAGAWTIAYTAGWAGSIQDNWFQAVLVVGQHLWELQRGSGTRRPGSTADEQVQVPGAGFSIPRRALELLEDGIYFGGIA